MDLATALATRDQHVRTPLTHLIGWVTGSTSTTVTVRLEDGDTVAAVPKLRAFSPSVDDVVLLLSAGGVLYCLGALNAAPTPPPAPDPDDPDDEPEPSEPVTRSRTFRPVFTGTHRGGWRTDTSSLLQGDWTGRGRNYGAAYYGTNGPSAVSGTALAGTVRLRRLTGGAFSGQRVRLRLLTHKTRPGGFPSFSKATNGPLLGVGDTATFQLPKSWVQDLINGDAGGIGIGVESSAPYVQLAGRAEWGPAMELWIRWERT